MLVRFMMPFVASNLLQVLYSLVDMMIVGRYVCSTCLCGVSQGSVIVLFAAMLSLGFCNSSQTLVAQLIGAGRRDELKKVIGTLFTLTAALGLTLSALLVIFRCQFVAAISVPAESFEMAVTYVLICGAGTIFTCGYNAVAAVLRGMGDSRHPFMFIAISSVLNVILDLVFTGWMKLGVGGAAFATAFSQMVSLVLSLRLLIKRRSEVGFVLKLSSFRPDSMYLGKMVRLGVPLAIQACAINITMLMVNSFVNQVGVAASATFGVGIKVDDLALKVALAVQYAAAPMIAQNMGAGDEKRVKSVVYWTWLICGIIFGAFTAALLTCGRQIFGMFTDDPEVLELAPVFIQAIVLSFPAMALMRGSSSFLHGTGNSLIIMIFALLDSGLRAVVCYIMGVSLGLGFYGFVLGYAAAPYGAAIPGTLYFLFGKWKGKRLVSSGPAPETE